MINFVARVEDCDVRVEAGPNYWLTIVWVLWQSVKVGIHVEVTVDELQ